MVAPVTAKSESITPKTAVRNRQIWGVLLIWSCLLALPFGRIVEIPVLLMAFSGLVLTLRRWPDWRGDGRIRLFLAVFAVSWMPIVISFVDAVNMPKTGEIALNHLRFLFSGLFIIHVLRTSAARDLMLLLIGWLLAFWVIDALVQYWVGVDLLGREAFPGRLSAPFGSGNTKFGLTLAVFLPVLWELMRRRYGNIALVIVSLVTVMVVFLSGQRSAWITVAAAAGTYALCLSVWIKALSPRALAALCIGAVLYVTGTYHFSEKFETGIDRAVAAFQGAASAEKSSIVHRFWIWKGAWVMFADNPLNGVGARGFRYAFENYAADNDPYLQGDNPVVPLHSHQLVIEIAAETGLLGLIGLALLAFLLIRAAARAPPSGRTAILPYVACVAAAYFPLNTHLAIYSAYWSQIVWYLLALYCAAAPDRAFATAATTASDTRVEEKLR